MIIKNNKKTITFDPWNKNISTMKSYPKPSKKYIPNWYKEIPPFVNDAKKLMFRGTGTPNVTLKKCVPFLDALTSGYMVTLEEDIYVELIDGTPFMRWRSNDEIISWHTLEQFPGLFIPEDYNYMVAKWANHWVITLPKGYSVLFSHPSNRLDLPFFTFSGIVSCDLYESPVQFPFILKKDFEGIIKAGTPVCQLNIIKNELWKTKVLEYNETRAYKQLKNFYKTFVGSYKANFWSKHNYE